MLPRVLAHDPDTASYHAYLLFYVAGFHTAQGSGGQFPCSCFEGTTQTAHIKMFSFSCSLFHRGDKPLLWCDTGFVFIETTTLYTATMSLSVAMSSAG